MTNIGLGSWLACLVNFSEEGVQSHPQPARSGVGLTANHEQGHRIAEGINPPATLVGHMVK